MCESVLLTACTLSCEDDDDDDEEDDEEVEDEDEEEGDVLRLLAPPNPLLSREGDRDR